MATKKAARDLNGYRVVYEPDHKRAMKNKCWSGYVYEHIKIAEASMGRPMRPTEVVHHLDGNRANNRTENLLVLERAQHTRLHVWLAGVFAGKPSNDNRKNSKNTETVCVICGKTLQAKQTKCCSTECLAQLTASKSKKPPRKELKTALRKGTSFLALGRKYGVSDNAVRKWVVSYKLDT